VAFDRLTIADALAPAPDRLASSSTAIDRASVGEAEHWIDYQDLESEPISLKLLVFCETWSCPALVDDYGLSATSPG